ncbi:hypothetical protein F9C07_9146 [Aspergillus flavus]|uniref:Uncharacterized protein n=1 Tax=Aspergillus flavus (strain ATCC 200026 / FGSC A1120 / IAM 13836 / NRRL 3357 / JCM 12722 / SRRC 167) TaxID=332952 RepID=A0A7U2MJN5_ASPFN|nr:hypothetical protein F9C07_9146 [Aspergillus flavus]
MEFRLNYHVGAGKSGEPRYKPCQVFSFHQIPHAIWFEDALVHYGVPTVVFDLYILVPDIDVAADLLAKAGWTFDMQKPHLIGNAKVDLVTFPQQRLISPDGVTRTVLLPAADWKYPLAADTRLEFAPLEDGSSHQVPFPPLAGLLDALIESWLDLPSDDAIYEHRQFHFDVQSGMETGTVPFWEHQRTIRDALLQGQYELRECSASRDNKDLFDPLGDIVRKRAEEEKQKLDAPELTETECYRGVLHGAV